MSNKFLSFLETYKLSMTIAGNNQKALKKSLKLFLFAYIFQGLAFSCFFPLLGHIFTRNINFEQIIIWLVILIILTFISLVLRWHALDFSYSKDLTNITYELRVKLGEKIKNIPLQSLYKYRTGELNSVLSSNVDQSVLHMSFIAAMFLEATIIPIVIIFATFFVSWEMALTIIIAIPIALPIYILSRKNSFKEKQKNEKAHSTLEADTIEYLQGLAVLRSINQVGENTKKLQKSIQEVRNIQKKGMYFSIFPLILMNSLIEFIFLLVLSLGTILIANGSFTIAALISLLIILSRLSEPLANLLAIVGVIDIMDTAFKNIQKLLDIKNFKTFKPTKKPEEFDILFEDVDFAYENQQIKALENISFKINSNCLTAIVGPSGSGKTTITKLIMRYADSQKGLVKIGKVNIKNITQKELFRNISVVFQDVYLFNDTIFNNIKMGNPKATDEEVKTAAKAAFCDEFINRLEKGYDTKVGEIGGSLSGGERQRISIARAILKNTPIVILDEPTSALDTQSEIAVQKALDELIKNKTVITIAHRLSTISHADKILVIEEGKLLEEGTHEELINNKKRYYEMLNAQQRLKEWNL